MKNNFPNDISKFKLIVSDFDGTLTRDDHSISDKVINSIEKWIASGRNFTIVTGRQYLMIEKECKILNLTNPVIVRGGAEVIDPQTGKIISSENINKTDAEVLLKLFLDEKLGFIIEKDNNLYSNTKFVLDFPNIEYKKISEFKIQETPKIVVKADEIDLIKVQKLMDKVVKNFPNIHITRTHGRFGYGWDVTSIKATKLHGIVKVMEILGVRHEEIVGIGDSYNDFPLLEAAGLKVAVGNSHKELKEIADIVVPSSEDDGVAFLIEELINNSKVS